MANRYTGSILALMAAHVLFASGGYLITKIALREFSPFAFGFWRFTVGLAGLVIMAVGMKLWPRVERGDWIKILGLAILAVPLNQIFFLVGMNLTVPSHASLLYGTTAAFALLLGSVLGIERVRFLKVAAIAISIAGLAIVVFGNGHVNTHAPSFWGDIWIFFGMFAWAGYTVLAKPLVQKYGALPATVVILIIGSVLGLPILLPGALAQDYSVVTWAGWVSVLYGGLIVTVASYAIWFTLLRRIDPSQVAILSTPQPIVTTLMSAIFLGEIVRMPLITGGLLVIGGIALMEAPAIINRTLVAYQNLK